MSDEKLLGMLQNPMDLMKTTTANPGKLEAEQKRLAVAIGESGLGNMRRDGPFGPFPSYATPRGPR
jgi:hypothetical protein